MNIQDRNEIEMIYRQYLKALEGMDARCMDGLWSADENASMVSILGEFQGLAAVENDFINASLREKFKHVSIVNSSLEVIASNTDLVICHGSYEAILAYYSNAEAASRYLDETIVFQRESDQWKILHIHQSLQSAVVHPEMSRIQNERLTRMIELLAGDMQIPNVAVPRSVRERKSLYEKLLKSIDSQMIGQEYLDLERQYFQDEKNAKALTLPSRIVLKDHKIGITQKDPDTLALDALVGFVQPGVPFDEVLSPMGGAAMVRDFNERMDELMHLEIQKMAPFWNPVKTLIEVPVFPVYGLLTKSKEEQFKSQLIKALQLADESLLHSVGITWGFKDLLNASSECTARIVKEVLDNFLPSAKHVQQVILIANKNELKKAYRAQTGL